MDSLTPLTTALNKPIRCPLRLNYGVKEQRNNSHVPPSAPGSEQDLLGAGSPASARSLAASKESRGRWAVLRTPCPVPRPLRVNKPGADQ